MSNTSCRILKLISGECLITAGVEFIPGTTSRKVQEPMTIRTITAMDDKTQQVKEYLLMKKWNEFGVEREVVIEGSAVASEFTPDGRIVEFYNLQRQKFVGVKDDSSIPIAPSEDGKNMVNVNINLRLNKEASKSFLDMFGVGIDDEEEDEDEEEVEIDLDEDDAENEDLEDDAHNDEDDDRQTERQAKTSAPIQESLDNTSEPNAEPGNDWRDWPRMAEDLIKGSSDDPAD